jgi:pSer/pThr/pTyr-binding forkhead associated (FHA) protein
MSENPDRPVKSRPMRTSEPTLILDPRAESEIPAEAARRLVPGEPVPAALQVFCEVVGGPGEKSTIQLTKPVIYLGRARGQVDLFVDDDAASRYHAAIIYRRGLFMLNDLGSTNGTSVNDHRVVETALKSGDRIRIGATEIRFGILGAGTGKLKDQT